VLAGRVLIAEKVKNRLRLRCKGSFRDGKVCFVLPWHLCYGMLCNVERIGYIELMQHFANVKD
jgi:hypothetical protein